MKLSKYACLLIKEGDPKYSEGIYCPVCQNDNVVTPISKIIDKRNYNNRIWRRRRCDKNHNFTTLETYGEQMIGKYGKKTSIRNMEDSVTKDVYDESLKKIKELESEIDKLKQEKQNFEILYKNLLNKTLKR